jgi:DNA-binding XRE family transcriptional regulator
MPQKTGLDLKLARVAARVKQWQIAHEMGVSPSRIAAIEREAVVTEDTEARYLAALGICRTGTSAA